MDPRIKDHIGRLDVELGGGIVSEKVRINTITNPMLVIALGGTGIDALLRLKYQVNRRFILPEDPNTKKVYEKPKNIEYLALETDQKDINKRYKGIGLDKNDEFLLIANKEVGSLLVNREILSPYISDWLSPDLSITDGMDGANGIRQAGRLLFFTNLSDIIPVLNKKIKNLLTGTNELLYVFIIAGVSGGTGGGTFLDIPYIIREVMEKNFQRVIDKVRVLGYLFTPDVNIAKGVEDLAENYIKKNGYAALKELDYWMNVAERNDYFKQNYANLLNVNSPLKPYDMCHLVSATDVTGKLLKNAYDYSMNVVAENITNFMSSEEKEAQTDEFAIHDYISNIGTLIQGMPKPYSANYVYTIIGSSLALLPIEEMSTYLAYRVFNKIDPMFRSKPLKKHVDQLMAQIEWSADLLGKKFNERFAGREPIAGAETMSRFDYRHVIQSKTTDVNSELEQEYLPEAKDAYNTSRNQLPGEFLEAFRKKMEEIFIDENYGPIYVSELIESSSDEGVDIVNTLKTYLGSLEDRVKEKDKNIIYHLRRAADRFGDAASSIVFWTQNRRKNEYLEMKRQEFKARADKICFEKMIDLYKELIEKITKTNKEKYLIFKDILLALNSIFERNGKILEDQDLFNNYKEDTYYWYLIDIKDVKKVVDKLMDDKNAGKLIKDFCRQLLEEANKWINQEEIDIISTISEFVTENFGTLITKSMEDFLRMKYGENTPIEDIIKNQIAPELDKKSEPVFNLSGVRAGEKIFPSYSLVSLPDKAPQIERGVKSYNENVATGRANFNIHKSQVLNRIFWLNTKNGVPLYAYAPLSDFEEDYEKDIFQDDGIGRHLVQTKEENWADLPSPIPINAWGKYENKRVRKIDTKNRELFNQALKLGCIVNRDNNYVCIITNDIKEIIYDKEWENSNLDLDKATPKYSTIRKYLNELNSYIDNGLKEVDSKRIFINLSSDKEEERLKNAEDNFNRSPSLMKLIEQEINKYNIIKDKIAQLDKKMQDYEDIDELYNDFIKASYTNTIKKDGPKYVYDADKGEERVTFVNLLEVTKYPEYAAFKKFIDLKDLRKKIIKKANKRSEDLIENDNQNNLLDMIKKLKELFDNRLDSLELEQDSIPDGAELFTFYREMYNKVKTILANIQ